MSMYAKNEGHDESMKPAESPSNTSARAGTNLGKSFTIKGEIHGDEDVMIDGNLEGRLDIGQHRLVVGSHANIRATIAARDVDVHGVVNGNIEATEKIILRTNSKLVGDLKMASVEIQDGAYFKGSIDITRAREADATAGVSAARVRE